MKKVRGIRISQQKNEGGYLVGPSHEEGGIPAIVDGTEPIEVEGGEFIVNKNHRINLVEKGSISINGVSLTISKKTKKGFQTWVIPHTIKLTNLSNIKKKEIVNVEIDILSKYIKKFINEKK